MPCQTCFFFVSQWSYSASVARSEVAASTRCIAASWCTKKVCNPLVRSQFGLWSSYPLWFLLALDHLRQIDLRVERFHSRQLGIRSAESQRKMVSVLQWWWWWPVIKRQRLRAPFLKKKKNVLKIERYSSFKQVQRVELNVKASVIKIEWWEQYNLLFLNVVECVATLIDSIQGRPEYFIFIRIFSFKCS